MRSKFFTPANLFIATHLFSAFGSALLYYAMILYLSSVYPEETYANYILIYTAIHVAAMLITGVITDRFNKLKILPLIQIINAILLFIMSFIFAAGNDRYLIYIIIVMSAANGVDSNLTSSALPLYIEKIEKLKTANAFLQLGTRGINVLVGMTAVLLFERKLYREGFWLNSLTYISAFIVYMRINSQIASSDKEKIKVSDHRGIFRQGLPSKSIQLLILILLITITLAPFDYYLPIFLKKNRLGEELFGYINSAYSFGGLAASVMVLLLPDRTRMKENITPLTAIYILFYSITSLSKNGIALLIGFFVMGFASVQILLECKTSLQANTPVFLLGKTLAFVSIILKIAKPISMAIARMIDAHYSIEIYFAVMVIALGFTLIILNQKRELS